MISLEKLLKELNQANLEIHRSLNHTITYKGVNIALSKEPFLDDVLYICPVSKLKDMNPSGVRAGFLLIPDEDIVPSCLLPFEWVLWDDNVDLDILFSKIQNVFFEQNKYAIHVSQLFNAVLHGTSIKEVVKLASQLLDCPIILTTASYKVIALESNGRVVNDFNWQFAEQYGYCSPEAISRFKNEGITAKSFESETPFLVDEGLAKDIPRIIQKIMIHQKLIGYIGVYKGDYEFQQSHMEFVEVFCNLLALQIKGNFNENEFTDVIYESLIYDLLNQNILSERTLDFRLKSANWKPKSILCVLSIPLSKSNESIMFTEYLLSCFLNCTPFAKTALYEDTILMVINCNKKEEYQEALIQIEKVLTNHNLNAGVSRIFESLIELKAYYNQATKAFDLGSILNQKDNLFYYYHDILLFDLLSNLKDSSNIQAFTHPGYSKLFEYDRVNHTDFCETILQYFLNSNNITATAKSLFIHRNTMSYRLDKISEITGCDFSQGEDLFQLYLSIKIHQWVRARDSF